jgi:hypothetical protein
MTVIAVCINARAQEVPLVTGEHWTRLTEEMKKATWSVLRTSFCSRWRARDQTPLPTRDSQTSFQFNDRWGYAAVGVKT